MSAFGRHVIKLSGFAPALPTPFDETGRLDDDAFAAFCDRQLDEGASALVVADTMGEAPTLTSAEHTELVRIARDVSRGRVPVIAGCGSNDTRNAQLHMNFAKKSGAAAGLCVAPYYNRPSQRGLIAHFSYLAENCELPIVLYNVPARTVTDLLDDTVVELVRKYPDRIIAIKDASGDLSRVADHRTGYKAYNLDTVMNGELEPVIQSAIQMDEEHRLAALGHED